MLGVKNQRHKRKESFSVLLISNTDRSSRQFQISLFAIRLVLSLAFLVCASAGILICCLSVSSREQQGLRAQLASQTEQAERLEEEKKAWEKERQALSEENEALRQTVGQYEEAAREAEEEAKAEEEARKAEEEASQEEDPSFPRHYPAPGSSLISTFSEEQPYFSISAHAGSSIIAAGSGTVASVGSDDTYESIVEIDHGNGYRTRYLCHEEPELTVEEGSQVQSGDTLLYIITEETRVDYQVVLDGNPVDPLTVIDAKG